MSKKGNYFKIGHITNPLNVRFNGIVPVARSCSIVVPARVNTFLCHHNYFAHPLKPQIYPANSVNFSIGKFTKAKVEVRQDKINVIYAPDKNKAIIEHIIKVMQKTLGIETCFTVYANNLHNIIHGGLGSSSAITSAVAQAINILMGNKLSVAEMTKLLSQNYGEESPQKGFVTAGISIGGSVAVALSGKSVVIVGGESEIWSLSNLPKQYCAVLLYPKKIKTISKATDDMLNKREFALLEVVDDGWGSVKENLLKEKIIPAIKKKDYSYLFRNMNLYTIGAFGDIPSYFNFRWSYFGIAFDKLIYSIFSKLFCELKIDENCFFVSSNGPLITIITKQPKKVLTLLKDFGGGYNIEKVELCNKTSYKLAK